MLTVVITDAYNERSIAHLPLQRASNINIAYSDPSKPLTI